MKFKGYRYPKDLILLSVHWYLKYPLSYRNLEEMLGERGMGPDHSSVYRWVQTFTPELVKRFNRRKLPVTGRWRLDETYIKVNGQWRYLYRAVDKQGQTVDFLLAAHGNRSAALRFLQKAAGNNGVPSLINIDKNRQERRKQRRDRGVQCRQLRCQTFNQGPAVQVFEQHCRTGPPLHQETSPTNAGIQGVRLRPGSLGRCGDGPHDP